jgi:hypothetical protein
MQRLAWTANDRDGAGPCASEKRKLVHGFALYVLTAWGRLLSNEREAERNEERSCDHLF